MVYRLAVTEEAKREFNDILDYLVLNAGTKAGANFKKDVQRQVNLICSNPDLYGISRMPELAVKGIRTFLIQRYIGLYCVMDDTVVLVHVFHQRQDYASLV